MALKPNHKCVICGAQYYACNDCEKVRSWRTVCDTIECYETYLAFIDYREGQMNDETFKEVLVKNNFEGKQVVPDLQAIFDKLLEKKDIKRVKNAE